ncbi:F510_1955 family glycosylhydrolase [Niallia sp. 03133]|uniref:F510_1955 family glycosylhydrolase n=1 Tax=Niallia sp. 03133 TaxID=3458060 RepID=UPI004043E141
MKKASIIASLLSLTIIVSGCSVSKESTAEKKEIKKGFKVKHLHGVSYAKDEKIYLATHEGMLATDSDGGKWILKGNSDFDFMGFSVMSDGTMMTSGHPGNDSNLPNPLGVMVSMDNGEEWKSKSLLGKVDFHILTSNFNNPKIVYGINQMDSGNYKAGIYKSGDGGKEWKMIDSAGLPQDLHQIYSLISLPDDENALIAGTDMGVFRSTDGGKTWSTADQKRLITAINVLPDTKELISYSVTNNEAGIMISKDQGNTWEGIGNDLRQDAVAYFGMNPKNSNDIVISTFENTVMTSKDRGETWKKIMDKGVIQ